MFDGFEIAVHDPRGVHRDERVADLGRDREELGADEPDLPLQPGRERLAAQALHDEVRRAVREVPVVDHLDDVRVPREPERLRLAPEPIRGGGVVRGGRAKQLDRDREAVADPRRLVDDAARARPHPHPGPVLPGDDRPFEVSRCGDLAVLLEEDVPLEGVDARGLRARLGLAKSLARDRHPDERPRAYRPEPRAPPPRATGDR